MNMAATSGVKALCNKPIKESPDSGTYASVTDKNNLIKLFRIDTTADVTSVRFKCDIFRRLMLTLPQTRVGWRENIMPSCTQQLGNISIAPASIPCAMNLDRIRHD